MRGCGLGDVEWGGGQKIPGGNGRQNDKNDCLIAYKVLVASRTDCRGDSGEIRGGIGWEMFL